MLNVSEFTSAEDASEALISSMQAFGYAAEDSMHVVDILNEVGNNFAISSDGIAVALQDSASSLMAAGNTLEQAVAMIAAANKVVQDPNSVGAALRTISLRIRGTSVKELEELGEDTEGAVESVSKLQEKIKGLTGVDILTDAGAYKDTYTILKEIAEVWPTLDDMSKAGALEMLAGKNRSNTLAAILTNIEDLEGAYEAALGADGSAMAENEKYLDSIQGKVDKFNNALQTMWNNELTSGFIKGIVDIGTALIKVIDTLGLANSLLGVFFAYLAVKQNANPLNKLVASIQNVIAAKKQKVVAEKAESKASLEVAAANTQEVKSLQSEAAAEERVIATSTGAANADIKQAGASTGVPVRVRPVVRAGQTYVPTSTSQGNNAGNTTPATTNNANKVTQTPVAQTGEKTANNIFNSGTGSNAAGEIIAAGIKENMGKKGGKVIAKGAGKALGKLAGNIIGGFIVGEIVGLAFQGLGWAISQIPTKQKKAEKAQGLKSEYETITGTVSDLESELASVGDRIDELNAKRSPTFAEEAELKTLQQRSAELQRQLDIQNQLERVKRQEVYESAVDSAKAVQEADQYDDLYGYLPAQEMAKKKLTRYTQSIKTVEKAEKAYNSVLSDDKSTKSAIKSAKSYLDQVTKIRDDTLSEVISYRDELANALSGISYIEEPQTEIEKQANEMLDTLANLDDRIAIVTGGKNALWNAFTRVSGKKEFEDDLEGIKEKGLETGEAIYDSLYNKDGSRKAGTDGLNEFIQELLECGFIANTTSEELQKVVDAIYKTGEFEGLDIGYTLNIDTEKTGIDNVISAIGESTSAVGLSSEAIKNLKSRYAELEGYSPERLFETTTNGIRLNTQAFNELEAAYKQRNKDGLINDLAKQQERYNKLTREIEECTEVEKLATLYKDRQGVLDKINDTSQLIAQYEGLTSAYNEWIQAQSAGNDRDMYDNILSGKQELEEEMARGWLDESSREYLELMSGKDLSTASWDEQIAAYQQLGQTIEGTDFNVWDFFTTDESGNSTSDGVFNFFDAVMAKQKELGENWVTIGEDGTYTFDFGVNGDKAIADALGISEELVQIILRAADDAGFDINLDKAFADLTLLKTEAEAANDKLKEIGKTTYTFNFRSQSVDDLKTQITEAQEVFDSFKNEDGTINLDVEGAEEARGILVTLIAQKQALESKVIMSFDLSGVTDANTAYDQALKAAQDFQNAYNEYEMSVALGVDVDASKANLDAAFASLQGQDRTALTTLSIDTTSVDSAVASITALDAESVVKFAPEESAIKDYVAEDKSAVVIYDVDEAASNANVAAYTAPTKYGNIIYSAKGGAVKVNGTAHASGNWGLPKAENDALVGELGQELVVDPHSGRYYTVGDRGAEMVNLPKDAIVFNHKQTESLLKHGYVTGRGKAYASGTAFSDGFGPGRNDIKEAIKEAVEKISGSSGSSSKDEDKKDKETFDFIEIKLEEIEALISKITAKIENFLDDTTDILRKDRHYDELVEAEKNKAETFFAAAEVYNAKAAALLEDIPEEYRDMAQNGAIAIEDFVGEDQKETIEAINEYREWAQKADDAEVGYLEAIAQISAYRVEQLEDIASDFENLTNQLETQSDLVQSYIDLVEESGDLVSANFYKELMSKTTNQIATLEDERVELQKILDDAVMSGDVIKGTDEWFEMVQAIYDVDAAILDAKINLEEFSNSILELHWENFERIQDSLTDISEEASRVREVIRDIELTDEKGNWTKEGITALGMAAQEMENAKYQADLYNEQIELLDKQFAEGQYSQTEYAEKLAELKEGQWESIQAYESAKDALIDLNKTRIEVVKEGIQKEIEAYEELIEKRKEDLDAQKDAHDWANTVKDHTDEIDAIQRQIDAMSGDTSAAATAKRKQLEEELAEAQRELDETYYDRDIELQQKALDDSLDVYRKEKEKRLEELDEYLKQEDQVIADSYALILANTESVVAGLQEISDRYGVSISDNVVSPWEDGATALGTYGEELDYATSNYVNMLERVRKELIDMQLQADKTAEAVVDSLNASEKKTQNATPNAPTKAPTVVEQPSLTTGSQVTVKKSATNFSRDGGNGTRMDSWVPGSTFTVYETEGNEVLIGKPGQGYTGWIRKQDIVGYATGTTGVKKDQLAWIDENGLEELVLHAEGGRLSYLTKGTSVIPADITENLMELGQVDYRTILDRNRPEITAPGMISNNFEVNLSFGELLHVDNMNQDAIPEVQKMIRSEFDNMMKQLNSGLRKYAR